MPAEVARLPRRVLLGPFTYRVTDAAKEWQRLAPEEAGGCWGFTHHESGTILVTAGVHPALQRVILLHEILHAAAFAGGQLDTRKRREEQWVVMVAAPLLDALRRSPGLAEFLTTID